MNKRIYGLLVVVSCMLLFFIQPVSSVQAKDSVDLDAKSAILVDADTGKILYAKDADVALPPASMVKIMTELLVWEAVEAGDIEWEDEIEIDDVLYELSSDSSFSGVGLTQGIGYSVKSLYEAMAINSDNATTMALAQHVAGSEGKFVELMNEKAEEIGLPDYQFVNASGLDNVMLGENYPEGTDPDGVNYLSARSLAMLSAYFIDKYPESLEIASIPETEFSGETIRNWNWMLPHEAEYLEHLYYEGVDGLKTGFTELAGNSFAGTAEVDGKRLITVVMKTDSEEARFKETAKLLDYGFESFETKELFPAGYQLDDQKELAVVKGKEKHVSIATKDPFELPIKKDDDDQYEVAFHIDEEKVDEDGALLAPVKKGDVVGTAEIVYNGENDFGFIDKNSTYETVDLIATEDVESKNWFMNILGTIGDFFSQLFSTIVDTIKGWFS